jgi:AcrR family transcriptional regulator
MASPAVPRARRTQEERSATTQALLLDATIDCLVDLGYSATTTTVIAERAGVSRGAQLHHFATKAELVAAAVERLARRLGIELSATAAHLADNGADRTSASIDALWSSYSSPLFLAYLELWVAARTDEDLRRALAPVNERLRRGIFDQARELFGPSGSTVRAADERAIELTLYLLHGMALSRSISGETKRAREAREHDALAAWKDLLTGRS